MPTRASKDRESDDVILIARRVVETAIGGPLTPPKKNPHAVALSRLGASKGGKARAAKLSAKKRAAIAKKAALTRWAKKSAEA